MFNLTSAAFAADAPMPSRFSCEGAGVSPPLGWRGEPVGTESFALIVTDPDAPDPAAPTRVFLHWTLWNIAADCSAVPEGASSKNLPDDAREGANDAGGQGWVGPCPPIGRHRYIHTLYALDTALDGLAPGATRAELEAAMAGHILGTAELIGTYAKGDA